MLWVPSGGKGLPFVVEAAFHVGAGAAPDFQRGPSQPFVLARFFRRYAERSWLAPKLQVRGAGNVRFRYVDRETRDEGVRKLLPLACAFLLGAPASAVTIDWVGVGDAGNTCETQSQGCFGAVAYDYRVAKYEVTNAQYTES
jgi:hypothetical protein